MKYRGLPHNPTADPDLFLVFNPNMQFFTVLARTAGNPAAMLPAMRAAVRQSEPSILIIAAAPLEELAGRPISGPRFIGWLMAIFAALALFLATIGIYGVISYGVSRRTREIGLRVALGAGRAGVLRMVVGRGMGLVIVGLAIGSAAAIGLTRVMASVMYGISATDPLTFAAASAVLATVALAACFAPALRASRIDPAIALRDQ